MKTLIGIGLLFGLGASICGCAEQTIDHDTEIVESADEALYNVGLRWPGSESTGTFIPVCYRVAQVDANTTAAQVPTRADAVAFARRLRHYIENTWGRVANINFTGWDECTGSYTAPHPATIVVTLKRAAQPNSSLVGYQGDSASTDVNLDIEDRRQPVAAIHEFGHALGFHHEFVREDWGCLVGAQGCMPCTSNAFCKSPAGGEGNYGNVCVNNFCRFSGGDELANVVADRESVMAATYVNNRVNGNTNDYASVVDSLSAFDILGAQKKYGRKPAGSLVGLGGRCVNINSGTTNWGNDMIAHACSNAPHELWSYDTSTKTLKSALMKPDGTMTSANICMNIWGGTVNPNGATSLKSFGCNTDDNEKFKFNNQQIRTMGNMCLSAESGTAGSYVSLQRCGTAQIHERWSVVSRPVTSGDFVENFTGFQLYRTNLCMQAVNTDLGTKITLAKCNTYAIDQTFTTTGGVIRPYSQGSRCLNIIGGSDAVGQRLGIGDACQTSTPGAFFYLSGAITSMGQCMDLYYANSYDGAPIVMYPCATNAQNQEWDYYFR